MVRSEFQILDDSRRKAVVALYKRIEKALKAARRAPIARGGR
jgi:hypothetical protein